MRKCKNWLLTFREWTIPRCEAPESFVFWTGLFSLASVVKRHVSIPRTLLGSWDCYPYLYLFFVSPPGKGRKTTTMGYTDDLLELVPNIATATQAMTQPDLMLKLSTIGDAAISIRSKEFGAFFNQSKLVMIDFLTALFDGQKKFDSSTVMRGLELAEKPCVNLLAATTPKWLSENLSEVMVGGGFTSRTIFIYEERVRRYQFFYANIDYAKLDAIRDNLVEDLIHIHENIKGDFYIDEDDRMWFEEWYQKLMKGAENSGEKNGEYIQRKPAYVLKIAQLLHLAYSDELVLNKTDIEQAINVVTQTERSLPKVFTAVNGNIHAVVMEEIAEYVERKGVVTKKELLSRFYHSVDMIKLLELINGLMTLGRLAIDKNQNFIVPHEKHTVNLTL